MGRLYRCLRAVVRAVTPRMTTTWEEPVFGQSQRFRVQPRRGVRAD